MQRLWQAETSWDESVSSDIHYKFELYKKDICHLSNLNISRNVIPAGKTAVIEMHGFCDASEDAYGACVYIRSIDSSEHVACKLLCSKSRVAPVRSISIPRLELCGAVLLAELSDKIIDRISVSLSRVYYWTDSTIVLAWIRSNNKQWKTFVANRVSSIRELTNMTLWNHVRSEDNPADTISRGMSAETLINSRQQGPTWLSTLKELNLTFQVPEENIPEEKRTLIACPVASQEAFSLFNRYSSLTSLLRITAYCLRFINNMSSCRSNTGKIKRTGPLIALEINSAQTRSVKIAQQQQFHHEIIQLEVNGAVNAKSKLTCLSPFLDNEGIIRVGGRLKNAQISYSHQHPMVLPAKHPLTIMIIVYFHQQLHAVTQGTMAAIRKQYWPLALKSATRKIVRSCITCFKAKPVPAQYLMGQLPATRLQPTRPFINCGVDYCGPFTIRDSKRRNSKTSKMYAAVFVCLTTKAVHLEYVSELSTEAFINTLRRFMARRAKITNLYSDNATNFVGANRELRELRQAFFSDHHKNHVANYFTADSINWHFIPPRAPHFGGIWESAIKSMKMHLSRIAGTASLVLEAFSTLLAEIEAILNSRPLTPLSDDPNDLSFLSPGHFLIGDTLTLLPDLNILNVRTNRLTQWQHIQQLKQYFWKRWKNEYLSGLQQRTKWKKKTQSVLRPGQMVIIKEDNVPAVQWNLGRVEEVFPGPDDIIRAVNVRTRGGILKRPVSRLSVLPLENKDN